MCSCVTCTIQPQWWVWSHRRSKKQCAWASGRTVSDCNIFPFSTMNHICVCVTWQHSQVLCQTNTLERVYPTTVCYYMKTCNSSHFTLINSFILSVYLTHLKTWTPLIAPPRSSASLRQRNLRRQVRCRYSSRSTPSCQRFSGRWLQFSNAGVIN